MLLTWILCNFNTWPNGIWMQFFHALDMYHTTAWMIYADISLFALFHGVLLLSKPSIFSCEKKLPIWAVKERLPERLAYVFRQFALAFVCNNLCTLSNTQKHRMTLKIWLLIAQNKKSFQKTKQYQNSIVIGENVCFPRWNTVKANYGMEISNIDSWFLGICSRTTWAMFCKI